MENKQAKQTAPNPALLSGLLSRIRHRVARQKLPEGFRPESMLDIGCGVYPKLMKDLEAGGGVGMDMRPRPEEFPDDVDYIQHDFSQQPKLPFDANSFDCVAALAVLEHIKPEALVELLSEIKRVLRAGGYFVATMPSGIGDMLLHVMAFFGLSSKANLEEHQDRYNCSKVRRLMLKAGFTESEIRVGRFELGMNIYIAVEKETESDE